MHHLADGATKQWHSGKHDKAGGESIPMSYSSGQEAELVVIGRNRKL